MKGKVAEPKKDEEKLKFEKDETTNRSIIVDSVRDHLIPYIENLDSSKKMYDSLIGLYTINNIVQAMSLKNELCDVRMNQDHLEKSLFNYYFMYLDLLFRN